MWPHSLTDEQKREFLPLVPVFVTELRSTSDRLQTLQAKMLEWQSVGVALGLLIDPLERTVTLYRPDNEPDCLLNPVTVDCSPELTGFVLDTNALFETTL